MAHVGLVIHITLDDMADPARAADVLNEALGRIADAVDQMQGIRGEAEVRSSLKIIDDDDVVVSGFLR